ncbi:MAG: alanine racemase [Gemmatimonadaceae bacterium]|nr:alanine racemase [Gemmatimonadaceae bacterium]
MGRRHRDHATAIGAALAAGDAPASVFTHFHSADVPDDTMAGQLARFTQVLAGFDERPACVHVANSAAILRGVPGGPWDAARPGIALYGVSTWPGSDWTPAPVATLTAPIVALRDIPAGESVSYLATWRAASTRRIATVACGYADGLPRTAGNTHVARVHDASVPIVGVVTMDMAMLDVTDVPCEVGDEATIIGWGGATVADLARATGRSPYELLTGLRPRGVRVSVDTGPARAPRLAGASA